MIIQEGEVRGRRCRVFTREPHIPDRTLLEAAFDEESERARIDRLRAMLSEPILYAMVFPTIDHLDVLQVFLASEPDTPHGLFACVVMTPTRVRSMLESESVLVEGFDLQMTAADAIDAAVLRLALFAWVGRVFPDLEVGRIEVIPWVTHPAGRRLLKARAKRR